MRQIWCPDNENTVNKVRCNFDSVAAGWDAEADDESAYFTYRIPSIVDFICSHASGVKCLDIGCAAGVLSHQLAAKGMDVYGTDISREMLFRSRIRLGNTLPDIEERFVLSEKGEIPFYGQQFDVITMLWVLPYIPDLRGCLRNVESFLKPNGILIASTVNRFSIHTVAAMLNYLRYIKRNPQWFRVIQNLWTTGFWTGGASADTGGCDITSACRFDDLVCKHGFNLIGELNFYNLRLGKLHFGDKRPLGRGHTGRWLARHLGWEHIGCFSKSTK